MNILLAPDKFRGSLTARQVAEAMAEGVRLVYPDAIVTQLPLADGGEGTAQVLTDATAGTWHTVTVSDPFGRPIEAGFGVSGDGTTACGESGAAQVFSPQKGATPLQLLWLDHGLRNLARLIGEQFGVDIADVPGAGAAGGLGAGALFFLNAQLQPGADIVLDAVDFDRRAAEADLILTGEGKLDRQTAQGKLIKRIVERAGATPFSATPVVALCGTLDLDPADLDALGLRAAFSVLNRPLLLDEAVLTARADVVRATFNVCRLFL